MTKIEAFEIACNAIGVEIEEYEICDDYLDKLFAAKKIIEKEIEEIKRTENETKTYSVSSK